MSNDVVAYLFVKPVTVQLNGRMNARRAALFCLLVLTAAAAEPPASAPPPRTRAEVAAVLKLSAPAPTNPRPLRILLVAGPKTHGPGQHDYPAWQKAWAPFLAKSPRVTTDTAFPWPTSAQLAAADLVVLYRRNFWDVAQLADLEQFQRRGGGLVTIHWAIGADQLPGRFAARTGLAYPAAKFRHGLVDLKLVTAHPIARGFPAALRFTDEPYWPFVGDSARVRVLATADEKAGDADAIAPVPVFWTHEPADGGRTFVCVFGHYMWTFDDPLFRLLLLRGMAWAAGEPLSRFEALATEGVKFLD